MTTGIRSILTTLCHSLVFGLLFIPLTVLFYFAMGLLAVGNDPPWSTGLEYEHVGFPCIVMFATTAASFFLSRVAPLRFLNALLTVVLVSILLTGIGGALDLTPIPYKSTTVIHWQRPVMIAWMVIPPWVTAIVGAGLVGMHNRNKNKAKPLQSA